MRTAAAWVASALLAFPLAYLLAGALNPPGAPLPRDLGVLPLPPSFESVERAWEIADLGTGLRNSFAIVAIAVPLSVLTASWAGFALTLLQGRRRRIAVGAVLVLLVVPASAVWVPRFVALSEAGLVDSPVPLILPAIMGTTPFAVLLFYWSFRRVPRDLIDAGRLEGLGSFGLWRHVAAPLVRPTTAAVAGVVFIAHWGNFVDALLYLYSPDRYTLPLQSAGLRLLPVTDTATILAGACIAAIPPVVVFALVQRRFLDATRSAGWLGR